MIKSGGSFFRNGTRCTIGAVILLKGLPYMVTVSHLFQGEGDHLTVDGIKFAVTRILKDYDLALIEIPPDSPVEITEFGVPAVLEQAELILEQAELINETHVIQCRIVNSGASLVYLSFPRLNMPEPGDSGSPILQGGKVIGLMSSVTLNNCMGTAISSNILRSLKR
ncbi:serine protease [Methanosarcina sp. UBA289]|uniref:serine protease n=1 Tax=Methanosarcina sp. UBA289 TaxID=1915574 RepID=UPI0025F02122|nr:serine protease [Methanosarcina sp. UBA289]